MILFLPISFYLILTICLSWLISFILKPKTETFRKRIKKRIYLTALVLFFPLGFLYLFFLFGIAIEDHYDVKKGSFLWYATMDNKTITEFPTFEHVGKVTYNSIGGDGPSISAGWQIKYKTQTDIGILTKRVIKYLEEEGYEINSVEETQFYWKGKNKKNEMNQLYSGSNEIGESLDLLIQEQNSGLSNIECSIVY